MQFYLDNKQLQLCELPTEMEKYRAFPNASIGMTNFGFIIAQKLLIDGFTIYNTQIHAYAPGKLFIRAEDSLIALHCSYRNNISVSCEGLGEFVQKEREFNISYVSNLDCHLLIEPGYYSTFDIHYSRDYLQRFIPCFPALEDFLKNIQEGQTCRLSSKANIATPEMLQVINNMLMHKYVSKFDQIYAECKSLELLTLALHCLKRSADCRDWICSPLDKAIFQSVHNWLIQNFDHPGTLKGIALRFGLNEYKLKKGFKYLYGSTVFDFLLKQKMNKAQELLRKSTLSIEAIAYETGYSKLPHFSTTYKNFFGYPPIVERRRE